MPSGKSTTLLSTINSAASHFYGQNTLMIMLTLITSFLDYFPGLLDIYCIVHHSQSFQSTTFLSCCGICGTPGTAWMSPPYIHRPRGREIREGLHKSAKLTRYINLRFYLVLKHAWCSREFPPDVRDDANASGGRRIVCDRT